MKMQRAVPAAVATMALALHASGAACPPGVAAPDVVTLMRSTANAEIDAWVVAPNCSSTTLSTRGIELTRNDIDHVDSLPTGAVSVSFFNAPLSRGADFSGAKALETVYLDKFDARLIDNLKLPSTVTKLTLESSRGVKSVDKLALPNSLVYLYLFAVGLSSLKSLPSNIIDLELTDNAFTEINFAIPPKLQTFSMDINPLQTLEGVTFPDSLEYFSCMRCTSIKSIRGVKWSKKLSILYLPDSPLEEFELRKSDYEVLSKQTELTLVTNQLTCSDDKAEPTDHKGLRFCVISDERFTEKYSGSAFTKSPSSASGNGTASSSASGDDSASSDQSNSKRSPSSDSSMSRGINTPENPSENNARGGGTKETTVYIFTSSPVIVILVAVSGVFGILLAAVGYRYFRSSRLNRHKAGETPSNTLVAFDTPMFTTNQDPSDGGTSQEYLSNDIRNDKSIIPYRIDQKDISISKQVARGGFGVIYRGMHSGRAVAVKQMLPDAWRNETQLINFMDEIRLCASLTHPKIVEFIGVAWSSLRDISVVIEFMDGGDLHSVLQKHARAQSLSSSVTSFASGAATLSQSSASYVPSRREWFTQWTTSRIKSKSLIAKDVAEAIVYLHSFSNPILHRDLKARNVLLDLRGNAKLSDFGISREMAVDETMTSEVGTSAWIAPEVLRGDRYSERADMYSFGVLLVELDKCRHPYAGEETLELMDGSSVRLAPVPPQQPQRQVQETRSQAMHQNMKIAMLVSAGHLRPRPSETCPSRVQSLISRCLSFAPEDRPSAMEAHFELRQILAEL